MAKAAKKSENGTGKITGKNLSGSLSWKITNLSIDAASGNMSIYLNGYMKIDGKAVVAKTQKLSVGGNESVDRLLKECYGIVESKVSQPA